MMYPSLSCTIIVIVTYYFIADMVLTNCVQASTIITHLSVETTDLSTGTTDFSVKTSSIMNSSLQCCQSNIFIGALAGAMEAIMIRYL